MPTSIPEAAMITPTTADNPENPDTETTAKVTPPPVAFSHSIDWYSDETAINFNTNGIAYTREWVVKNDAGEQIGP